jgi:hypothetical protein
MMRKDHPIIACLDRGVKGKNKDVIKQHFNSSIIKPYRVENVLKTLDRFLQ